MIIIWYILYDYNNYDYDNILSLILISTYCVEWYNDYYIFVIDIMSIIYYYYA